MSMDKHFKIYLLAADFYKICDWKIYKLTIAENRPVLLLVIEDLKYPDAVCCIPLTKDDDKGKYQGLSEKSPDLVHRIKINLYDSYLLIANMFYVRKEFIGKSYTVNGIHFEIKSENLQRDILKKVHKVNALMNRGILNFVPREEVYKIQKDYLENLGKMNKGSN